MTTMGSERLWRTSSEDLREESVHCKPWADSIAISPGKLQVLSNPGRREKLRTAKSRYHLLGQSLKKEKPVWTQLAHLDARKESSRRTFVEEGGEVPLALRNSGGGFLPTHLSEQQWAPAAAQIRGADNWAINLWWQVWNSENRVCSVIWKGELWKSTWGPGSGH